jgi:hypothetical protein
MRIRVISLVILFAASASNAQWTMRPIDHWITDWPAYDSIYVRVPVGSTNVVHCGFEIEKICGHYYTAPDSVILRQDSLYGNRFQPKKTALHTIILSCPTANYTYYDFDYFPKYEDTSIIQVIVDGKNGYTGSHFIIVGVTSISSSNEFSLSRSDFGTLSAGDTSIAELRLFNQTPDTEFVTARILHGYDFEFLDSQSFPIQIDPGDSVQPMRVQFKANCLRTISTDSIVVTVQRRRNGLNYGDPLQFVSPLLGKSHCKYYEFSRTQFGYIHSHDSSAGTLKLFNPTEDTARVSLSFLPSTDFTILGDRTRSIVIPPNDSTQNIPIAMHASINRKVIKDTATLNIQWTKTGEVVSSAKFNELLSGGCSELRFSVDSISKHITCSVGKQVAFPVVVYNLSPDSVSVYMSLIATGNAGIDYFSTYAEHADLLPYDSGVATIYFAPQTVGVWEAQLLCTDIYDSAQADHLHVVFSGTATVNSGVRDLPDQHTEVYPNPSPDWIHVVGPVGFVQSVEVYNKLGARRLVPITDDVTGHFLDVRSLPPGAYYIRLNGKSFRILVAR